MSDKPRLLKSLFERKLFWVAVGAFASAAAMLLTQALIVATRPHSEMLVFRAKYDNKDTMIQIIAAAGDCLGKFDLENYSHAYFVRIPTKNLSKADYECLLRAGPFGEHVRSPDASPVMHGEDWESADLRIVNSD